LGGGELGFDICIGNPPYVRQEKIKEIKPYLKEHYEVYTGVADLYVYFFEKGINVLKQNGQLGFICSNKFTKSNYGKNLRKLILANTEFRVYFDHTYSGVFEDATTYPSVFIFKKAFNPNNTISIDDEFNLEQKRLNDSEWSFERPEVLDLRDKIKGKGLKLKKLTDIEIYRGVLTGFNEAFIIDEEAKNRLIDKDPNSIEIIKPILTGRNIKRGRIDFKNLYLIWTYIGVDIDKYTAIKEHLDSYKAQLKKRQDKGKHWWELRACSYYDAFENEKLIYPNLASKLFAVYDDVGFFTNQKCFIISSENTDLKFLSTILSSKLLNFVFSLSGTPLQGNYYDLNKKYIEQLPLCIATDEEKLKLIKKADQILRLNREFQEEVNGFKHWIRKEFNVDKMSKKLDKYYELSEDEFIDALRKKKVDTKSRENREYLEREFIESLVIIKPLLRKIEEIDNEIDQMVYALYGLTDDEIGIIEENLN
jgi:hypothetical protein